MSLAEAQVSFVVVPSTNCLPPFSIIKTIKGYKVFLTLSKLYQLHLAIINILIIFNHYQLN